MSNSSARPTSTDSLTKLVNQTTHGFAVGDVIRFDQAMNKFVIALADSLINCTGSWIVSIFLDVDNFYITQTGWVNNLTGPFTIGIQYYLDPAGGLTQVRPSAVGEVILACFVPDTTTSGYFYGGSGELITSGSFSTLNVVDTNQTMMANNAYATNDAGSVTLAIPPAFSVGDEFVIFAHTAGGFQITMGVTVKVYDVGLGVSTTAGGTITSTVQGNTITFVCIIDSTDLNPAFRVLNSKGALTYA